MKRTILISIAVLAAASAMCLAGEMSLEEVLDKHYEAMGGVDAWDKVEAVRYTGTMTAGPMQAPFSLVVARGNKMRMEFTFQGMTGVQAFDGETAWMRMPFLGKTEAEEIPAEQAKQLAEQADVDGILMGWHESGYEIEYLGEQEIEGTPAHVVKVTLENGDTRTVYLDSEYFVEIHIDATATIQGTQQEVATTIGDYKEVDGLLFAHAIETHPKGMDQSQNLTLETIEVNPDLPKDFFTMPAPKADEAAKEDAEN